MPINQNVVPSKPGSPGQARMVETSEYYPERNFTITGVTKDLNGAALGSCTVNLFETATNLLVQTTVSDASGNYSFIVDKTKTYFEVAYKAGAPDVAGSTVNTVAGT